jgi:hypothetical protein
MTINPQQFADQVVIPTLQMLEQQAGIPFSDTAFHLIMGTIAQESLMGTYLVQQMGPALGIGQIEPDSLATVLAALNTNEKAALATIATPASPAHNVVANLPYAVAIMRLFYWKVPAPLPAQDTVTAVYSYYKQWYNTSAGAATLTQFAQNWALTGISLPAD